jgi:hypothetical protein
MADLLPGVTIAMGGRDWIVPPLTLGQLRRLGPELGRITSRAGMLDGETISAVVKIVAAALRRNYPDIAEDAVEEMLDLGNAAAVLEAVLTGSGLRRAAPGEAGAAADDGTSFTASSPPPSVIGPATSTS